jgi:hypothetical protein
LDSTRGCHSIWRRRGRYQEEGLEEIAFFICFYEVKRFLQKPKMLMSQRMYKTIHKQTLHPSAHKGFLACPSKKGIV